MIKLLGAVLLFMTVLKPETSEFQKLMGKKTPHWMHVTKAQDIQALENFEALYEKNKHIQYDEEAEAKIPKIIHFIWLGPNPFPPQSVENIRMWIANHPDWKVKFWTDRERFAPCSAMEVCDARAFPFLFLSRCYEQSTNWGEKADILCFEILYQEGGIYAEHATNCLKRFDDLTRYDFFCGLETPHPPFIGRNITCGNGIVGARPFHPVIGGVLELIDREWEDMGHKYRGWDGYSRTQLIAERTYLKLTDALKGRIDEDNNLDIILPAAYFFAKEGIPALYSKHFTTGIWTQEYASADTEKSSLKAFNKLQKRNHLILWIGRGALSINLLAFSGLFFYVMQKKKKKQKP